MPYRGQKTRESGTDGVICSGYFLIGIHYASPNDLNGQAVVWCNKVKAKECSTTGEVPLERLKKDGVNSLSREHIIEKINLHRVEMESQPRDVGLKT